MSVLNPLALAASTMRVMLSGEANVVRVTHSARTSRDGWLWSARSAVAARRMRPRLTEAWADRSEKSLYSGTNEIL